MINPKTPSNATLLWRTSKEVLVVSSFCWWCFTFHFWSSFCCYLLIFFSWFYSLTLPWTIAWDFTPHFTLSAQPIVERFAILSFSTIPSPSYRKCYSFEEAFFTHRCFLFYAPSPAVLTQPAFIKASLEVGSSSLKLAGLRALYWSLKHRPDLTVCLIHSNPQKIYMGRFYLRVRAA